MPCVMCSTPKCAARLNLPLILTKKHVQTLLFPVGLTLLLVLALFQKGTALSLSDTSTPTPTPDRLARPPLPEPPSQADHGAQEYWFQCMPCHGDRGQGLTDEFRMLYPPEEQNCWESGCHGPRFYENGWTIPRNVPALVGPGVLQKFPNAFILQAYIKASMPFQWPGTLDDETAWQLTAFLARENGLWDAREPLNPDNALQVIIAVSPVLVETSSPTVPTPTEALMEIQSPSARVEWGYLLVILMVMLVFIFFVRLRHRT